MIALVDLKKRFEKLCSQYEGRIAKARKSLNDQVSLNIIVFLSFVIKTDHMNRSDPTG